MNLLITKEAAWGAESIILPSRLNQEAKAVRAAQGEFDLDLDQWTDEVDEVDTTSCGRLDVTRLIDAIGTGTPASVRVKSAIRAAARRVGLEIPSKLK